jgi:hypothetical protein
MLLRVGAKGGACSQIVWQDPLRNCDGRREQATERVVSKRQDGKMSASIKKFSMASNINWTKKARTHAALGGRFVCFLLYAAPLELTHIHKTTHMAMGKGKKRTGLARSIYLLKFYVRSQ